MHWGWSIVAIEWGGIPSVDVVLYIPLSGSVHVSELRLEAGLPAVPHSCNDLARQWPVVSWQIVLVGQEDHSQLLEEPL